MCEKLCNVKQQKLPMGHIRRDTNKYINCEINET